MARCFVVLVVLAVFGTGSVLGTGPCDSAPCQNGGTCQEIGLFASCECPIGFNGVQCETAINSVTCTFETGSTCFLSQSAADNFNWTTNTGGTPSGKSGAITGPESAIEGTQYAYAEMSAPRRSNDKAIYTTTQTFTETARCLLFKYHMYGRHVGSLSVDSSGTNLLAVSGSKGIEWQKAVLSVPSTASLVLSITAQRSSGFKAWSGDIAIDDVALIDADCGCRSHPCNNGGSCVNLGATLFICICATGYSGPRCDDAGPSVSVSCSFEFGETGCFLQQDSSDDFDWTYGSGSTPSRGTGPSNAALGSRYLYLEASRPVKYNQVATMKTVASFSNIDYCLTFNYHMYGNGMGTLRVRGDDTILWSKSGDQGNLWHHQYLKIAAHNDLVVCFDAIRGATFRSDMAIDNVTFVPCCKLYHSCCK